MELSLDARRSRCYDICKAVTMILVILGHATIFYTPDGAMEPARASRAMAGVAEYIYSFHMPLYVLLSGCVWSYCVRHGKYREAWPFLAGKAKRLLIPYLTVGLLMVAPVVVFCGYTEEDFFGYALNGVLLGRDARHLWFLLVLFLLYLTTLAARPLVKKNALLTLPFCVALFLVANFMPQVFKLRTACKYALFFYLGVCADRYYPLLEFLARRLRFVLPVLFVLLLGSVFWNPNFLTQTAYTLIGMAAMLGACSLLTGSERLQKNRAYQYLRKNGFGLYLFHAMVIYLLFHFLGGTQIPPVLLALLSAAAGTLASVALVALLRKAHLGFILGETR